MLLPHVCNPLSVFSSQLVPHSEPAGSIVSPSMLLLLLESHAFTPNSTLVFPPPALNPKTPLGSTSPSPAHKSSFLWVTIPLTRNRTYMFVFMQMCVKLPVKKGLRVARTYSAVQLCFWPGAVCWPLSPYRPWGPVSCGGPKRAEPAHRRRWSESGPACWNSSACLTAHPAPERRSKIKHKSCQICGRYMQEIHCYVKSL